MSEFKDLEILQEHHQPKPLHVLIVEDVEIDVELTLLELNSAKINLTYDIATTEDECQKYLQEQSYDAVLSDYRLPNFNGLQVLKYLQESGQEIPFILITGSLGEEAAVECIRMGMTDYILKDRLFRLPLVFQRAMQEFDLRRQQKQAIARIEQQAWREAIINRIVQSMRETLVLADVLQTTADLLHESLQVSRCLIFQKDQNQQIRAGYVSKFTEQTESLTGLTCKFFEHYHDRLEKGEQIVFDRIGSNVPNSVQQIAEDYNIYSIVITPLQYQQTYLGGISLHQCDHQRDWSENELCLISAITDQCAIAIHQSELYENAQLELSERKKMELQLRHDAFHDALTGLPNRSLFLDRLNHALQLSNRRLYLNPSHLSEQFAVLFLDLDRFKVINDSLGHLAGDQLLKDVAQRLDSCLRGGDTVARLGGDEFVMLLEEIDDIDDVLEVVQRIKDALKYPVIIDGQEIFISTSIGLALNTGDYTKPEEILRDADTAMYRAKEKGRSRYEIFNPEMHTDALRKLRVENELRRAIERQEFCLYYQPIVSLQSNQIIGFEALIRWQHPDRGLVMPAEFIPLAEDTGLIVAIDCWVLQEACSQLSIWQAMFPSISKLTVNVNLSAKQFEKVDLASQIEKILKSNHLQPTNLKIEVTESLLIEKTSLASQILGELNSLHIYICIDDFGTGYSSLSYLHRFPIHTLKIDRSFIIRINADHHEDGEIVKAIITLAINLGLTVVAEGVENLEQLEFLRLNNCHAVQGYYFYKPLEAEAIGKLFASL
jgi:diguanylate cyclase (GGDEF)-like protein